MPFSGCLKSDVGELMLQGQTIKKIHFNGSYALKKY